MDISKIKFSQIKRNQMLQSLRLLNELCDNSERIDESQISYFSQQLPNMIGILPMNVYEIDSFKLPFERLVINETICKKNKRLKSLSEIRYPPVENQKNLDYNRASLKGQSIFYAGCKGPLALAIETKPKRGQLFTISKWKQVKSSLKVIIICQAADIATANPNEILPYYNEYERSLEQFDPDTREIVIEVNKFLIKAFTKPVDPKNKKGYLFSALLSNLFLTDKNKPADAIYYPSVPNKASAMNIAIKPEILDSHFEMIGAEEGIVDGAWDNQSWFSMETGVCKSYNKETLELNWETKFLTKKDYDRFVREYEMDLT